jgi:hypothetical protein
VSDISGAILLILVRGLYERLGEGAPRPHTAFSCTKLSLGRFPFLQKDIFIEVVVWF